MTVANVILEPHRVRLVQDTLSYCNKKPFQLNRKMSIVNNSLAFTVRGNVVIGDVLEDLEHRFSDFESALAIVAHALAEMPSHWYGNSGAEVTILAWDGGRPKASRVSATKAKDFSLERGRVVNKAEGSFDIRRFDLAPGVYLAPSLGNHEIRVDLTDEHLLKIALLQQDIAIRHGLNMCVGGDIEVLTIDAAGISVRKLGEYPNKALTVAQIARQASTQRKAVAA